MLTNEIINIVGLSLSLGIAFVGVCHRFLAPQFYRWTQLGYDLVNISCFYYAIVLLASVVRFHNLNMDGYANETTPAICAILISVFFVRVSHFLEQWFADATQVRTYGNEMVIKTKVSLPSPIPSKRNSKD